MRLDTSVALLATSLPAMVVALVSPPNVAAQYASGTSTAMPFPTNTLASADAQSFITSQWSVNNGHISNGATDISFVDDPFPSSGNTSSHEPVFRITYPAGSYSQGTGGAQWYSRWNTTDGSGFNLNSMLLSYEIAFDSHFNASKGASSRVSEVARMMMVAQAAHSPSVMIALVHVLCGERMVPAKVGTLHVNPEST
jgi:hypothetical protein